VQWGRLICERNKKLKISCQTPFNKEFEKEVSVKLNIKVRQLELYLSKEASLFLIIEIYTNLSFILYSLLYLIT
jgi:hypothetical protein